MPRPESIENRWDILYRDYPEVYDAFAAVPYHPTIYEALPGIVDLEGKVIVDAGAGTGRSTLAMARQARSVFGVEIEPSTLRVARQRLTEAAPLPVRFLCGDALALPVADASVDLVTGITLAIYPPDLYRGYIREGLRAAREQVVYVGIPPGWYGGELAGRIGHDDPDLAVIERIFLEEYGFSYEDIYSTQEYGTLENIASTYGFIFGRQAIEILKNEQKTSILWKFRVYYRQV